MKERAVLFLSFDRFTYLFVHINLSMFVYLLTYQFVHRSSSWRSVQNYKKKINKRHSNKKSSTENWWKSGRDLHLTYSTFSERINQQMAS